ncbi:MAG: substrate-binding domain-containing protein [Leptolyngbyaceae cyanobacterium]
MGSQFLRNLFTGAVAFWVGSCSFAKNSTETSTVLLRVGGSAETYEIIELLLEAYVETTDEVEFDFLPPSQTSGGIEGVEISALDIGGVSRELTEAELSEQLSYLPLAETPLVFIVHESVTGVTNISAEQIKAIYSGDITNWQELGGPDKRIVLFDFAEDENEKQVLRKAYLGANLAISSEAIVFPEDDELLETVAITDFSIAAVPLEDTVRESPVTVLDIDGVTPSVENIQSGKYPMALTLGIVVPEPLPTATQAFVQFVRSSQGKQLLIESEYIFIENTQ